MVVVIGNLKICSELEKNTQIQSVRSHQNFWTVRITWKWSESQFYQCFENPGKRGNNEVNFHCLSSALNFNVREKIC